MMTRHHRKPKEAIRKEETPKIGGETGEEGEHGR